MVPFNVCSKFQSLKLSLSTISILFIVTATHEVSELKTDDKDYTVRLADSSLFYFYFSCSDNCLTSLVLQFHQRRIQGSLMADAVCSILASVFTSMPNTTFSQNNGVIAMTKCASRRAGIATGGWLIFMGVFAKIAGVITSIPDCVLGGMTIFLFANVLISGITLFGELNLKSRRIRFISVFSMCVGVGVTVWPYAFLDMRASPYTAHFWECSDCSETMKGLRNAVSIFLSTGYCIGSVLAIILNAILPDDPEEPVIEGNVRWDAIGQKSVYFEKKDVEDEEEEGVEVDVSKKGTVVEEEAGSADNSGEGETEAVAAKEEDLA